MAKPVTVALSNIDTCLADEACNIAISKLADKVTGLKELPGRVAKIKTELEFFNDVVQELCKYHTDHQAVEGWFTEARKLAFLIQDAMDKYLYLGVQMQVEGSQTKFIFEGNCDMTFKGVINDLDKIDEEILVLLQSSQLVSSYAADSASSAPSMDNGLMGNLLKFLTDKVVQQRKVLSVVGSGGIGKTALASQLYGKLRQQFQIYAFVIDHKLDTRNILQNILCSIHHSGEVDVEMMKEIDLISQIGQALKDKRYIIFIDDMWDTAWESVMCALPDNDCGSRVIVTTRLEDVARTCCAGQHDLVYSLKPLSYLNSMRFFMAGASAADGISPDDLEGPEQALFLSCSGHRCDLQACALYLSMFREKHMIQRDNMVRKWIAERFISENIGTSTLEDVANDYFDELIDRNVIQLIEDKKYSWEEETYQVNPLMLSVLQHVALERYFAICIYGFDHVLSFDQDRRRVSICFFDSSVDSTGTMSGKRSMLPLQRSLIVSGQYHPFFDLTQSVYLRVLDLEGYEGVNNSLVAEICRLLLLLRYLSLNETQFTELPLRIGNLQYLETLELRQTQIATIPQEIGALQNLETLDVSHTQIASIPQEIGELQNLHTLDVRQTGVKELPNELLQLPKLTRLFFGQPSILGGVKLPKRSRFKSVKVLGTLDSREWSATASAIKELTDLTKEVRELAILLHDGPDDKEKNIHFLSCIGKSDKLQSLTVYGDSSLSDDLSASHSFTALEKLKVAGRFVKVPLWIAQITTLAQVDIRVFKLEPNDLSLLGHLPSLKRLGLELVGLPRDKIVITTGAGFRGLVVFSFDCRVPWLTFDQGAMPSLKHLVLRLYSGPAGKIPSAIVHLALAGLRKASLRYFSQYKHSACVKQTIDAMRKEAAEYHAEMNVISVNGGQDIFFEKIKHDILPSNTTVAEAEIEEL